MKDSAPICHNKDEFDTKNLSYITTFWILTGSDDSRRTFRP